MYSTMPQPTNWQELLDFLTCKAKEDDILIKLKKFTDQENVLKICLQEEFYRNKLLEWITASVSCKLGGKSILKASKYRQLGNDKYRCKDDRGSLLMYTESIRYAPDNSEDLSLALANRSAALFHMQYFEKGYPSHLQYKLHMRKGQCLLKLGKCEEAVKALETAKQALELVKDAPITKKSSLEFDIEKVLHEAISQLQTGRTDGVPTPGAQFEIPSPSYGENEKFAYASAALDLKVNEEKGRHVIANRDIQMGDILFVEKPFAFVVLPDQYGKHCHHCVKAIFAAIPCHECTEALYCSEMCRKESWTEYHQWECHGGLELLHSIGIAHLGLRVVLKAGGLDRIRHCINDITIVDNTYGKKDDNYYAVYQLMPHLEDMQPEDRLQYGLTAALLTLYLRYHSDYFEKYAEPSPHRDSEKGGSNSAVGFNVTKEMVFVGGLILRHIAQLVCNGHAITKLDTASDQHHHGVVTESQVRIATAIYPSASMMNHSCDPTIINSFCGQYLVVRACKSVFKEDEVFNCYGPHFRRMSCQERMEALKSQYFFTCSCEHCSHPVQYDFQDRFSALVCSSCEGPLVEHTSRSHQMVCCDCGNTQGYSNLVEKAFKAHNLYNEGSTALEMGNVKEALQLFQTCLRLQKDCLYKNNKDLMACKDKIAKCYAVMGEYGKSVEFLLDSIATVEEQFGSHSVELANELQKLSDVMICDLKQNISSSSSPGFRKKHKEAVKCVNNAKQIFELHYGPWNSGLQEIIEKEQWLRTVSNK
ncbi:SET and MYND domain-containing protein 4 isoform X2 [Anabrus simplex]|uniref:SET and MYND domain-containing protein 4 isoform X2 n=1 Tax=Anabrus simplex TaxID=316456 RepID=UPI0035A39599